MMTNRNPEVHRLLAEAVEWRLLGLVFEYPTSAWRFQIEALLRDLDDESLRTLGQAALESASEGMHIALFGPGGTVPLREVTYQGGVQYGYLMAELSAYYEAFGYCPSTPEAEDHLAVEIGFIAYLKMKQALAIAQGDHERAAIAASAADAFLRDHLRVVAERLAAKLDTFAPDYLSLAGRRILDHAGTLPRSSYPLSAPWSEDETAEMTCGPALNASELIKLEP